MAIDADIGRITRASSACRRLTMTPGVSQRTALAFPAAIDDAQRFIPGITAQARRRAPL